jgi:hypothetical protein
MGILKKFWRSAAVIMCIMCTGALSLGLATAAQAGTTSVSPRHECGGFNGNVQWSENPATQAGQIHIWGELWNNKCPSDNLWLFVSYNLVPGGSYQFFPIATTYPNGESTVGVNWYNSKSNMNFSGIKVRVCDTPTGVGCGTAVGV